MYVASCSSLLVIPVDPIGNSAGDKGEDIWCQSCIWYEARGMAFAKLPSDTVVPLYQTCVTMKCT